MHYITVTLKLVFQIQNVKFRAWNGSSGSGGWFRQTLWRCVSSVFLVKATFWVLVSSPRTHPAAKCFRTQILQERGIGMYRVKSYDIRPVKLRALHS